MTLVLGTNGTFSMLPLGTRRRRELLVRWLVMVKGSFRLFLTFLIGAVLAGSSLILMAPALVDPDGTLPLWIPVALGLVLIGCGFVARSVRPDRLPPR